MPLLTPDQHEDIMRRRGRLDDAVEALRAELKYLVRLGEIDTPAYRETQQALYAAIAERNAFRGDIIPAPREET